jgi:hypothetical protein
MTGGARRGLPESLMTSCVDHNRTKGGAKRGVGLIPPHFSNFTWLRRDGAGSSGQEPLEFAVATL